MQESSSNRMAEVYRFLAMSMRYPYESWFDQKYISGLETLLSELEWHDDLQSLVQGASDISNLIDILQIEHTRLFITGAPRLVAPPYASVYVDGYGAMYGEITANTKKFYRENGFQLASDKEVPDHLVNELEFLALLAGQGEAKKEEIFLKDYFRPWFISFKDKVLEGAENGFYPTMVKLIDFFTQEEEEES